MNHKLLFGLCGATLLATLACEGGPEPRPEAPEARESPEATEAPTAPTAQETAALPQASTEDTDISPWWRPAPAPGALPAASSGEEWGAFDQFATDAFPPTLPPDENHAGAWLRTDCLLCHEDGTKDAPIVQHVGMSPVLLQGRCRSCHVPAPEPDADTASFLRTAFPPTLPRDADHRGGWLRDDCLKCHADGTEGARKVLHQGMAPVLLQARCRSCHLPGESSEDAHVGPEAGSGPEEAGPGSEPRGAEPPGDPRPRPGRWARREPRRLGAAIVRPDCGPRLAAPAWSAARA